MQSGVGAFRLPGPFSPAMRLRVLRCFTLASLLASHSAHASAATTRRCWIYDKIFPVTEAAFSTQHVTPQERNAIEKRAAPVSPSQARLIRAHSPWARPPTASDAHLLRWMRDPYRHGGVLVFVARPIEQSTRGWYSPWVALNTNVTIDPVECSVAAYPGQ